MHANLYARYIFFKYHIYTYIYIYIQISYIQISYVHKFRLLSPETCIMKNDHFCNNLKEIIKKRQDKRQ